MITLRVMRTRTHSLRRLIAMLCGVLMMHTSWMAASAECAAPEPIRAAANAPAPSERSAHAHHHTALPATDTPATDAPSPAHDANTVRCPMAMACALSVMTTDVPTVASTTVGFTTPAPVHVATAPRRAVNAPEPPPPRA